MYCLSIRTKFLKIYSLILNNRNYGRYTNKHYQPKSFEALLNNRPNTRSPNDKTTTAQTNAKIEMAFEEPFIMHPGAISTILNLLTAVTSEQNESVIIDHFFYLQLKFKIYMYKITVLKRVLIKPPSNIPNYHQQSFRWLLRIFKWVYVY